MSDLLRFEIWQIFFTLKTFAMCIDESIDVLKLP